MTDTTQQDPRDIKLPNECDFEQWYVTNAFDYVANPLGSMQCGLMRKAWHAATAARDEELARLREQFVAQQARIVMMRNALLHYSDIRPDTLGRTVVLSEEGAVARNALATTDDLSALAEHDKQLWNEALTTGIEWQATRGHTLDADDYENELRSLKR